MSEGIIIDDGGSTRIKWLEVDPHGPGRMEDLLDVGKVLPKQSKHDLNSKKIFDWVRIVWQDKYGIPHLDEREVHKMIEIDSHLEQKVTLEVSKPGMTITVSGNDIEPIVEARQHDMKRRYIVSNSGPIGKITVDNKPVYDTSDPNMLPGGPVIYTSVVLMNQKDLPA